MSGSTFDAFVSSQRTHNEPDWAAKIQEKYWRARQKFLAKIERNEDSCIVLSDSKLDAKLEIYRSIDSSCARLTNILENYQNSLFMFANEENALGILLKECGRQDKTKAGKIMSITGKSLTQSSHQRIRLYMPLLRMFQEMETFHTRAVEDTAETVDKLEDSRSQYRASLLWMKDISEKLNPDVYRQLDRFRRVQAKVKEGKRTFDGMQMDVVQKIDLLMASRCNLMNQILAPYQTILLQTFERNHNNLKSVDGIIRNEDIYEYEFKTLKQLNPLKISDESIASSAAQSDKEPNKKEGEALAEENLIGDIDDESGREDKNNNDLVDSQGESGPSNLINTSPQHESRSKASKDRENQQDTLGLLETLFGNCMTETSSNSQDIEGSADGARGAQNVIQSTDFKSLMSSFGPNLLDDETDEEKQIANLLGPSENLRRGNVKPMEDLPPSADDDIFARWARDADIDLLRDERGVNGSVGGDKSSANKATGNTDKSSEATDNNINLMDIEPTRKGTVMDFSRFYA